MHLYSEQLELMKDITTTEDLTLVMNMFYSKMLVDQQIGYIFTDVAKLNLEKHLPMLVSFWSNSLFHTGGYKNNVTQIHKDLNELETLTPKHFERWLELFNETIDTNFKGEMTNTMKLRAKQIAITIQAKLGHFA